MLQREKERCMKNIEEKREALQELLLQQVCFRNLIKLSNTTEGRNSVATHNSNSKEQKSTQNNTSSSATNISSHHQDRKIRLPFIVVNTSSNAVIECETNSDRTAVMFDFSMPFKVFDDVDILTKLGLGKTSKKELSHILPHDLLTYCEEKKLLKHVLLPSTSSATTAKDAVSPASVTAPSTLYDLSHASSSLAKEKNQHAQKKDHQYSSCQEQNTLQKHESW